jgi:hypothetical protein
MIYNHFVVYAVPQIKEKTVLKKIYYLDLSGYQPGQVVER